MPDPASSYQRHAREVEETVVLLRNRLLQLRAEVDEWPDARHGLRVAESGDSADADELAAVVAAEIRDARAALAHVDAALRSAWDAVSRLYVL
ncbi:hypothetical protein ACNJ7K_24060 [Rhodococcus aetherivorans]